MKRVERKNEYSFLLPKSEKTNIENFKGILKYFYLSTETHRRVIQTLSSRTRENINSELDKLFKLNTQRRAWFELELNESNDIGYKRYINLLQKSAKKVEEYDLSNYNTYRLGKVKKGKQEFKLFKFLLQNEFLSKENIEKITTIRAKATKLYLCISRNPIDYLFCSTNQNFSSCMSMTNGDNGYFLGLGGLSLDPNRFLIFISTGRIKRFNIQGYEFKHFGYQTRSWGLILSDNSLCIVNTYPYNKLDFYNEFKKLGYKITNGYDYTSSLVSKYTFLPPRLKDHKISLPYLDGPGYACIGQKVHYSGKNETYGSTRYNIEGSINDFTGNMAHDLDII